MSLTKINFQNIPVQAGIISNIINLDVESNSCFHELDNLISSDQGVASLILRVVNSSFYSRGNNIATIPLAVSLLGYSVVRSLALLAFSRSLFSQTKNVLFRLHIWQHSLLCAIASQNICLQLGNSKLHEEAFIAGLMHDIGKVLIFTHDPATYEKVFNYTFENNCKSIEAETKFFGFNHCQVGLEAVSEWKLPIRFKNYMGADLTIPLDELQNDIVLKSMMAANFLLKSMGIGASPIIDIETKKNTLLQFGLNEEICNQVLLDNFIDTLMENETYKLCVSI